MQPEERDAAYLLDMLLAARKAAGYVQGMDRDGFASSSLHQSAVLREMQIVGEAAYKVSERSKNGHPHIDWAGMIGMRHRLVHDYRNVRVDVVWDVLMHEVPPLISYLERIVPPEDPV